MSCESSEANAGKSLSASQLRPKSRSVHRDCEASERNGGSLRDRRASEWGPREAAGRTSKRSAREEAVRGGSSEQEGSERECVTVFFLSILGVGGKGRRQRVEPNMGRAGLRLGLTPALCIPAPASGARRCGQNFGHRARSNEIGPFTQHHFTRTYMKRISCQSPLFIP